MYKVTEKSSKILIIHYVINDHELAELSSLSIPLLTLDLSMFSASTIKVKSKTYTNILSSNEQIHHYAGYIEVKR